MRLLRRRADEGLTGRKLGYVEALAALDSRGRFGIHLGLSRTRALLAALGHPERAFRGALIAGTNGKGSVLALVGSALQAAGYRTGETPKPHLVTYRERLQIDGAVVDQAAFARIATEVLALADRVARRHGEPTEFELLTAITFRWFAEAGIDLAVVEVGLGGRLDATNIVDADVAVLCSVGMDHADWLGDTLELIGREKAGVFRAGQQVVLGDAGLPDSVHRHLAALGVRPAVAGSDYRWHVQPDGTWRYEEGELSMASLPAPSLAGSIQYGNAAAAIAAARRLLAPRALSARAVAEALGSVRLPGRLQFVPGAVEWVLDVAHNEPAARVLARELAARPVAGRTLCVLGMLADKDVAAVVQALAGSVDEWIPCTIDAPRGLDAASLRARLPGAMQVGGEAQDIAAGCELARARSHAGDRVLVCGSFHTVGPALQSRRLY